MGDYKKCIEKFLTPEKTLCFAHGFNIVFGQIKPPKNMDIIMVAPNAAGIEMRKQFLAKFGVPGIISIRQNVSGKAKKTALALAKGLGITRIGAAECTFEQETYSDLFAEETVIAGGVVELMRNGFEVLVKKGIPAEMAYFCCLHEMRSIVDLIYNKGIEGMFNAISNTAEYGSRTAGKKIGKAARKEMEKIYARISSGKFSKEWMADYKHKFKTLNRLRKKDAKHKIEIVGKRLRKMMWEKGAKT